MTPLAARLEEVETDGYTLLPGVFTAPKVEHLLAGLGRALDAVAADGAALRGDAGGVYAARNVLALWPEVAAAWRQPPLPEALAAVLGPRFGLVRALFFDKPPERSWSLPAHKDLTIAVRDNRLPSRHFTKPTRKAGVPHVEAPRAVLEAMLTARVHLDEVTEENGPMRVVPGSHRLGKAATAGDVPARPVLARRWDVLLIRPLVEHSSAGTLPGTRRHRRTLHLEFAASPELPDGYAWHDFVPGRPCGSS